MLKEFAGNNPNEQETITEGHQIIDLVNNTTDDGGVKKKKSCCGK